MIQTFDFAINLLRALLWKHNRAERLEALVRSKQAWYEANQSGFWQAWLRDVFDLRTANAFGLQVWARILGVRLSVPVDPSDPDKPTWGFGPFFRNFGRGNFGRLGDGTQHLTLEEQRMLLRLRYLTLISRATIPDMNRAVTTVFGDRGRVYALDPLNMGPVVYVFTFDPGRRLLDLLLEYDALPRPSAVGVSVTVLTRPRFGFGPYNRNFNRGTFGA